MSKSKPADNSAFSPIYHWQANEKLHLVDGSSAGLLLAPSQPGEHLVHLFNVKERDSALSAHQNALAGTVATYQVERNDRTYLVCVEPMPSRMGCVATAMDITLFKQQEASVAYLKRHNESILNAAGEGIYGLNLEGEATFVNPAAIEMTGWSAEETIGHNIHYMHHHSYVDGTPYPHTDCPIYAAIKDGEVHQVDDELFWRKDGSGFPVEYTSTPIYDGDQLAGAVVVFKDITERKQAEQNLLHAFQEVETLKEQLQEYNSYLQNEIREDHNFGQIIGSSNTLLAVLQQVNQVARTAATVLITGESGTGKELISRSIHNASPRHEKAMVKINCGAIAEGLVESELFGHEKGAFTHAHTTRRGRFELANGGTLFLDEVGDLPMSTQVKLLRVLQEQELTRVGGAKPIKVDVRIVAATNRDLMKMVARGEFREDLYYRLNLFPIEMPSLRERRGDIEPLAQHFLTQAMRKFGKPLQRIQADQIKQLQAYSWPGNIRELQNLVERAVILAESDRLEVSHLIPSVALGSDSRETTLKQVESNHILRVLDMTGGIIAGPKGAATILDIHPNTLRSRMKRLGIEL